MGSSRPIGNIVREPQRVYLKLQLPPTKNELQKVLKCSFILRLGGQYIALMLICPFLDPFYRVYKVSPFAFHL